jgi:hypothetical protein
MLTSNNFSMNRFQILNQMAGYMKIIRSLNTTQNTGIYSESTDIKWDSGIWVFLIHSQV